MSLDKKTAEQMAVSTDEALQHGRLVEGGRYHIVTPTYAYAGILRAVDAAFFYLEDAELVYETGALTAYMKGGKPSNAESLGDLEVLVERPVVAMYRMPDSTKTKK